MSPERFVKGESERTSWVAPSASFVTLHDRRVIRGKPSNPESKGMISSIPWRSIAPIWTASRADSCQCPQENLFRTFCEGPVNSQHLIHHAEQSVERGLDCVAAVDNDLAVQDFLENLGVRKQAVALVNHFLQRSSREALVRMRSAHQIHGNIRVDQNHGCAPVPYPLSTSASMSSISPTG
jgi:hypothetical protein